MNTTCVSYVKTSFNAALVASEELLQGCWYGTMPSEEAEKMLKGKKRGTFFFREELSGDLYLSGINHDNEIQHTRFRKNLLSWTWINGGEHECSSIQELIAACLHCDENAIYPLSH